MGLPKDGIVSLVALVSVGLAACGSSSSNAGSSPAPNAGPVVKSCNRLANENLTISGLTGISVPAQISRDCGVLTSQGLNRCRIEERQINAGLTVYPWIYTEGIGFDVGLNHYDLWFKAIWYDDQPAKVKVPGTGITAVGNNRHGGTAEVNMNGGRTGSGAYATFNWTAGNGSIDFNGEADPSHPIGGGVVDMEMTPFGKGAGPVHIKGTWFAERPCGPGVKAP
jgi:hypothetical protein